MIASTLSRLWRNDAPTNPAKVKILFVCMGNICRSPTADGVMKKMLEDAGLENDVLVESAGTHAYHVGENPDERSIDTAAENGVDIAGLRARLFVEKDFRDFDYVLAMDGSNLRHMMRRRTNRNEPIRARVLRLLDYVEGDVSTHDVPDPYYGGVAGFERVYDLIEAGCSGLMSQIQYDIQEIDQSANLMAAPA